MTTIWNLSHRLDSFADFRAKVADVEHERLADMAANYLLNDWCGSVADDKSGKRLPYIGWYWRSVDFASGVIPIGDCGDFIGFMENNKWDYDERDLTPAEAEQVIGLLWEARNAHSKGGSMADLDAARDEVLGRLWDLMQTFDIEGGAS